MIKCSSCGTENSDSVTFCRLCGLRLEKPSTKTSSGTGTSGAGKSRTGTSSARTSSSGTSSSGTTGARSSGAGSSGTSHTTSTSGTGPSPVVVESFWDILRYPMGDGTGVLQRAFIFDLLIGMTFFISMQLATGGSAGASSSQNSSGVISLLALIPAFVSFGYLLTVIETTINGEYEPPGWWQIRMIATNTLFAMVSCILAFIIPIMLLWIGEISGNSRIASLSTDISAIFAVLGAGYWILVMCRYAETKRFTALIDFPNIIANFVQNFLKYLFAIVIFIIAAIASFPIAYFVIPIVAIYFMFRGSSGVSDPHSVDGAIGRISSMISGMLSKITFMTAFGGSLKKMFVGCFAVIFLLMLGIFLAEMIILMVYGYWLLVFAARMFGHAYRGDKITFKRYY